MERPIHPPSNKGRHGRAQVIYALPWYPYAYQPAPQVIIVQAPAPQIIEVPVERPQPEPPAAAAAPEPPPFVPSGDRTLYVIRGCYVGNVMPKADGLPPNCDLKNLVTYTP